MKVGKPDLGKLQVAQTRNIAISRMTFSPSLWFALSIHLQRCDMAFIFALELASMSELVPSY